MLHTPPNCSIFEFFPLNSRTELKLRH
jgi:hypothetical protein